MIKNRVLSNCCRTKVSWVLRQTLHVSSSLPSPQPSRPEHTIAVDRHLPLPHLSGQYWLPRCLFGSLSRRNKKLGSAFEPQICGGSSLPSRHDMMELQNSYSGRHSPLLQRNVCSGQLRFRLKKFDYSLRNQYKFRINNICMAFHSVQISSSTS